MKPTFTAALVATFLILSSVAGAGAVTSTQDSVTLTVSVETADGDPVANADLTASWKNGSTEATTASNGKAFIDVPPGANVTIEVDHENYVRNEPYFVRNATESDVTVEVAEKGTLSVVATQGDGPIDDAKVVVRMDGTIVETGSTNADGVYSSNVIEQGEYSVTVVKPSYYRERRTVTVDGDVTEEIDLKRGSVELSVSVVDDHFEEPEPVEDVKVQIGDVASVTTLSNGESSVRVPVNTEFKLETQKDGYETTTKTFNVRESDIAVELAINRVDVLNLTPANERVVAGERLSVTITDEYDEPVPGAKVRLNGDVVGETDSNGDIRFEVSEPGNHSLVAEHEGVESDPVEIKAIADESETTETETGTATATETETEPETTEDEGAGFGVVLAVLALVAIAGISRRR